LPTDIPIDIKGSFQRKGSRRSEATLNAEFIPRGDPHVPESLVWCPYEPTWMRIAEARLSGRLSTIDVELRYEDDYGVSAELALELSNLGLKIGGKFEKQEQTVWKIQGSFS